MKVHCMKCGIDKEAHFFHRCNHTLNGLNAYCKSCRAIDSTKDTSSVIASTNKLHTRNSAMKHVKLALQSGYLKKDPCEVCNTILNVVAYHSDYSKPFDIKWLCMGHYDELKDKTRGSK